MCLFSKSILWYRNVLPKRVSLNQHGTCRAWLQGRTHAEETVWWEQCHGKGERARTDRRQQTESIKSESKGHMNGEGRKHTFWRDTHQYLVIGWRGKDFKENSVLNLENGDSSKTLGNEMRNQKKANTANSTHFILLTTQERNFIWGTCVWFQRDCSLKLYMGIFIKKKDFIAFKKFSHPK